MFKRRGRSMGDCLLASSLTIRAHLRVPDKAHQLVYRRNVKTRKISRGGDFTTGQANGLECDDDMSDGGHRARGFSVGSKVVVFPENIRFIRPGCRIEGQGIYLRVESCVDNPTHGASWLWRESHEGATETSQLSFSLLSSPHPSSFKF